MRERDETTAGAPHLPSAETSQGIPARKTLREKMKERNAQRTAVQQTQRTDPLAFVPIHLVFSESAMLDDLESELPDRFRSTPHDPNQKERTEGLIKAGFVPLASLADTLLYDQIINDPRTRIYCVELDGEMNIRDMDYPRAVAILSGKNPPQVKKQREHQERLSWIAPDPGKVRDFSSGTVSPELAAQGYLPAGELLSTDEQLIISQNPEYSELFVRDGSSLALRPEDADEFRRLRGEAKRAKGENYEGFLTKGKKTLFDRRFSQLSSELDEILPAIQVSIIKDANAGLSDQEIAEKYGISISHTGRLLGAARRTIEEERFSPNGIKRVAHYDESIKNAGYKGLYKTKRFARTYYTTDWYVNQYDKRRKQGRRKGKPPDSWSLPAELSAQGYQYYTELLSRPEQEALRNGDRYSHLFIMVDGWICMKYEDVEEFRRIQATPMRSGRSSVLREAQIRPELLAQGYRPARIFLTHNEATALTRSARYRPLYIVDNGVICMREEDVLEFWSLREQKAGNRL